MSRDYDSADLRFSETEDLRDDLARVTAQRDALLAACREAAEVMGDAIITRDAMARADMLRAMKADLLALVEESPK